MRGRVKLLSESETFRWPPDLIRGVVCSCSGWRCDRFRGRILFLYNRGLYHHHGVHDVADRRVKSLDVRKSASLSASAPNHWTDSSTDKPGYIDKPGTSSRTSRAWNQRSDACEGSLSAGQEYEGFARRLRRKNGRRKPQA